MKGLFLIVIMSIFITVNVSFAGDVGLICKIDLKENQSNFEYVEIKTSKSLFRIYPCGKIEKKIWKEIHANDDDLTIGYITTVPADTCIEWYQKD